MAVPKKRTSKSKTRSRKSQWKRKVICTSIKAISLARSSFTNRSNSYVYTDKSSVLENQKDF